MCRRVLHPEILGGQDAAEAIALFQGRDIFPLPNINDAGQQSMWNSIKRTALVIGLLTATAAFAHAQSSAGGSNGSSAGVGAGTSGSAGTTTGTGGSTLGTSGTGSMGGTSSSRTTGTGTMGTGSGTGGSSTMGGSGATGGSSSSGSR